MKKSLLAMLCLSQTAVAVDYRAVDFEGLAYHVVMAEPAELSLRWRGADGQPLATFRNAMEALAKEGQPAWFLMNGGIFEPGGIPSGLHVEDGQELRLLNLRAGQGNFYLKPNGVWYVAEGKSAVIASEEYPKLAVKPRFALQSGPLLLRAGKIHPAFQRDSANRKHRNGVGVNQDGQVVLAMTDSAKKARVNFHGFARLFLHLGCQDALFLDGEISQMYLRGHLEKLPSTRFAAIIVARSR